MKQNEEMQETQNGTSTFRIVFQALIRSNNGGLLPCSTQGNGRKLAAVIEEGKKHGNTYNLAAAQHETEWEDNAKFSANFCKFLWFFFANFCILCCMPLWYMYKYINIMSLSSHRSHSSEFKRDNCSDSWVRPWACAGFWPMSGPYY